MRRLFVLLVICLGCAGKNEKAENPVEQGKPEENRFTPVVLTAPGDLNEPMVFEVAFDNTVFLIERHGAVKQLDLNTKTIKVIGNIAVYTEAEQGLLGLTLDPDFKNNHWLYLYYAHAEIPKFVLSRFELVNGAITNEKVMLEIPCDRPETSHTGGGMTWDSAGNLYLTVGNNTANSLYAQTDERPGRARFDDQRGAGNTNDLRGKILRIHPEPDGSYTIPDGNLFPKNEAKARPEIYVMGNRNPWRIDVDSKTGYVYWGEVGPDADADTPNGPMGYDELNQAKKPGFFGWPYFIGENHAYPIFNYVTNSPGEKLDPQKPLNRSVNNTGLVELPPAQPAFISYPYRSSEKFPLVGSSSRCAIGGPVFRSADFRNGKRTYPSYYEGKWFAADLSRFWIMAITMDDNGDYVGMERFLPSYHPAQPIDIKFGPEGDLYVLEYGSNTANSPVESRLVRIEYNSGNRKPFVQASADKRGGAVPLTVGLSAKGTVDYDDDLLTYAWTVTRKDDGAVAQTWSSHSGSIFLTKPGVYVAKLTVTDPQGLSNEAVVEIIAGNEPPVVEMNVEGNQQFFFDGNQVPYAVRVEDAEDGALGKTIEPSAVSVSIDYASEGFDYVDITMGHVTVDAMTHHPVAEMLMSRSDCKTCHQKDAQGIGPSWTEVSNRYKTRANASVYLGEKIRKGSAGVWKKEVAMPAHPTISVADAETIAQYVLSVTNTRTTAVEGNYTTKAGKDNGRGTYIFRAAYRDRGHNNVSSQVSESVVTLRSPVLLPVDADVSEGVIRDHLDEYTFLTGRHNGYIGWKQLDLTGVKSIRVQPNWHLYDIYTGGTIEVRLDRPDGKLIGSATMLPQQFNTRYRGAFGGLDNAAKREAVKKLNLPPLDESKFFAPGANKNSFTIPSYINISEVQGRHDLYFVFIDGEGNKTESLFPLAEIVLSNKNQP